MGRNPRPIGPSITYHVTVQCNNAEFMLNKNEDFRLFLDCLIRYKEKYKFRLFSYCLMNSHVHLIIQTPARLEKMSSADSDRPEGKPKEPDPTVSNIMHDILWRYSFTYNKVHGRKGHFFNSRFKSPVIESDAYGLTLLRYVSQNPVRAGMVENARDWEWSSYRHYADGKFDSLIDPIPSYAGLSVERVVRSRMIRELVEGELMKRDSSWSKNYVIGTEQFIKKVTRDFLGNAPP
jgi:REP element-mobilizing transposase RayT